MKKLVIGLVLSASLAIVPSAFALKAMTADSMKDTTGQAGVSIAADDIIIWSSAGTTTYTDIDGTDGTAASIEIEQIGGTLTTIRAIFDDGNRGGFLGQNYYNILATTTVHGVAGINNIGKDIAGADLVSTYGAAMDANGNGLIGRPINIDVSDSLPILTAALRFKYTGDETDASALGGTANVAGVQIGLPTVEIYKTGTTKAYRATADGGTTNSANSGAEYIRVTKTATTTAILGGTIEIAPH